MNHLFTQILSTPRYHLLIVLAVLLNNAAFADGVGYIAGTPGQVSTDLGFRRITPDSIQYVYLYANAGEKISFEAIKIAGSGSPTSPGSDLTVRVYSPIGLEDTKTIPGTNLDGSAVSGVIIVTALTQGIWTVALEPGDSLVYWKYNMDVLSATDVRVDGRVYTENLLLSQNISVDFSLYHVRASGYKYTSTWYSYFGIDSKVTTDSYGNTLPAICASSYKSHDIPYTGATGCGNIYKQFFTGIDNAIPVNAPRFNIAGLTTVLEWLNPSLSPDPIISGLAFTYNTSSATPVDGSFTVNITSNESGAMLLLDLDNNGDFMGVTDRAIPFAVVPGNNTIIFDGNDSSGAPIPCGTTFSAKILINKLGEIHFKLTDVEALTGLKVERTNGAGSPDYTIYWDDRIITATGKSSSTTIIDGTAGINSNMAFGEHGWPFNLGNTWGNDAYIDNWAYIPANISQEINLLPPADFGDLSGIWPVASATITTCTFTANAPSAYNGTSITSTSVWAGTAISLETATNGNDSFDDGLGLPVIPLNGGFTYSFTVTLNANRPATTAYYRLWFDWNNDGDFTNDNDGNGAPATYSGFAVTASPVTVPVQVKVPFGASPNYKVRLVISDAVISDVYRVNNAAFILSIPNGEIEDYNAPAIILPVSLLGFTAQKSGARALLQWKTATEQYTAYFSILHSTDGAGFTEIGRVNATGSSTTEQHYNFVHEAPGKGNNYYSLKVVDRDGTFSNPGTRLLHFGGHLQLLVFPNPVTDLVTISGLEAGMEIKLLGANGQVLYSKVARSGSELVDMHRIAPGVYLLQVMHRGKLVSASRLVKKDR